MQKKEFRPGIKGSVPDDGAHKRLIRSGLGSFRKKNGYFEKFFGNASGTLLV